MHGQVARRSSGSSPGRRAPARARSRSAAGRRGPCGSGPARSCRGSCRCATMIPRISATATDDADGGREEVLHRQPSHLAEVAHRRLAAVVLPVRVRDERRGGVERHVPRRRVEVLRVQAGEVPQRLRAQDEVQQQPAGEREDDQALGVGLPVLTLGRRRPAGPGTAAAPGGRARGRGTCARRCRPPPCSCPSGIASAVRIPTNRKIVSQPRNVIGLELLPAQQRVQEVDADEHRDDQPEQVRARSYPVDPGDQRDQQREHHDSQRD